MWAQQYNEGSRADRAPSGNEDEEADFPVGHVQVHAYQRIPMTGSEETGPHELGKFKTTELSVA